MAASRSAPTPEDIAINGVAPTITGICRFMIAPCIGAANGIAARSITGATGGGSITGCTAIGVAMNGAARVHHGPVPIVTASRSALCTTRTTASAFATIGASAGTAITAIAIGTVAGATTTGTAAVVIATTAATGMVAAKVDTTIGMVAAKAATGMAKAAATAAKAAGTVAKVVMAMAKVAGTVATAKAVTRNPMTL